ncbi:hypothetical protein J416_09114 [Gracilibacillus halophilus YIM-C55.5]|uniref:NETI motif-containing protein n=1 Tax=Gracilibacillus halophilus YIM-C55.5 TaxID=1308866 RepID=N4WBX3_9BACI|nr:NETI motif-containing protein [Gracilibacillus halophilus]ENH96759.1 hypothetical protein J416_09114 [Gracilibacillus halophilus YIM-C55.5]
MKFEVAEDETIDACLKRIEAKGYRPIRRMEQPIFQENGENIEPIGQKIIFDAVLAKHER